MDCKEFTPHVYHWRNNWFFGRNGNGSVTIFYVKNGDVTTEIGPIPPHEWASIVAAVSASGENALSHAIAKTLHNKGKLP